MFFLDYFHVWLSRGRTRPRARHPYLGLFRVGVGKWRLYCVNGVLDLIRGPPPVWGEDRRVPAGVHGRCAQRTSGENGGAARDRQRGFGPDGLRREDCAQPGRRGGPQARCDLPSGTQGQPQREGPIRRDGRPSRCGEQTHGTCGDFPQNVR